MIVKVKRARPHGWTGLKTYAGAITRIGPAIDSQGNQITGLNAEDQARLEKALGYDPGFLKKGSLRDEKLNNYWTTYTVDIEEDKVLELDTEIPEQELAYLMLKAQRKVAKSLAELKSGHGASCIFVIFNEEDEAVKDNKRGKNKRLAGTLFDEMSDDDKKNMLMLYGRPANSVSPAVIESQLEKLMEDDPTLFLAHAKDPAMKMKVFILNLVRAGILIKKGSSYMEIASEDVLGFDMDSTVKYLESKANNAKLLQLKEALKNRG